MSFDNHLLKIILLITVKARFQIQDNYLYEGFTP